MGVLFSCQKTPQTHIFNFSQAIDSMQLAYNHGYTLYVQRNNGGSITTDSDFVIFHQDGTISEIANVYSLASHTYPDTLTFKANTSYDDKIMWDQVPNSLVFGFYPIYDTVKGYLMHDYLNHEIMYLYQGNNYHAQTLMKCLPATLPNTTPDSTAVITGYLKY